MNTTNNTITVETQKQIVTEFITNKVTKAQLSKQYNVSPRSVGRYIEKFEEEIKLQLEAAQQQQTVSVPVTKKQARVITRGTDGLTQNQRSILESYYKQKTSAQKIEDRRGKVGRAKNGIKTIRFITMEILENLSNQGLLNQTKKEDIIKKIASEASVDMKVASQYFSGHKIYFMK